MSLICAKILDMDKPELIFAQLGMYMVTAIVGLIIHLSCLMGIYTVFVRKNPFIFFKGMLQAWLMAIATSSRWVRFSLKPAPPFPFYFLSTNNSKEKLYKNLNFSVNCWTFCTLQLYTLYV